MLLTDALGDYVNHIRHERGLAPLTVKQYTSRLRRFIRFLQEQGIADPTLDHFTLPNLRKYQYDCAKDGIRPRTFRSLFDPLESFGEFLVQNGALAANPTRLLILPKLDAAIRLLVNDEQVRLLFASCDRLPTPRQCTQARAVLSVLCYGALRRQECCDLRLDDVNLSEAAILVRSGKGSKSRRVFVCRDAVTALRDWMSVREPDCTGDYLFMYDRARRLHLNSIASLIRSIAAVAGLRDNDAIKPHSLRHWGLTNLLKNGVNVRQIQQFAGHSRIETTARYLHTSEEELREIAELTALKPLPQEEPKPEQGKILRLPQDEQGRSKLRRRAV